jgi:hypothetical protein
MGRFASSSWPLASRLFLRRTKMWVSLSDVFVCKIVCWLCHAACCTMCLWQVCVTVSQVPPASALSQPVWAHAVLAIHHDLFSSFIRASLRVPLPCDRCALVWSVCDFVAM